MMMEKQIPTMIKLSSISFSFAFSDRGHLYLLLIFYSSFKSIVFPIVAPNWVFFFFSFLIFADRCITATQTRIDESRFRPCLLHEGGESPIGELGPSFRSIIEVVSCQVFSSFL
ncbi:hypothetical protein HAT2_00231 [Candidatus Similichlamydia laticola]|uniref:Uncharacterized protein n=1 Tax=Candidatus Similichlamydia laticola TaxID=2170265 RepID=A0A369KDT5_9BACT|nr:hypothetical protein HAT2_00231 [Candidatus Similichlamydia laticola]